MTKEQKNMRVLYIGVLMSTILNFIPFYSFQLLGLILFFVTILMTYIYKYKSDVESFQYAHSKYLIKTIWIFSLVLLVGIILAGILADNSLINMTMDQIMNGQMVSETALEMMMKDYMEKNSFIFLITIGPSFIYLFYRLAKGMQLVRNNQIILNPKSWL